MIDWTAITLPRASTIQRSRGKSANEPAVKRISRTRKIAENTVRTVVTESGVVP